MEKRFTLAAAILSCGLILAGVAIAFGVKWAKDTTRYVSVKGVSERPVVANQGTWSIRFAASGESMDAATVQSKSHRELVLQFLAEHGFTSDELRPGTPTVSEQANYNNTQAIRYTVSDLVTIISSKVDKLSATARDSAKLLSHGIALTGWENPSYYFTDLSSIKPTMIEEATKDARKAAEKFAQDSGSKVGAIRHASQGFFSFNGESSGIPEAEQIKKIARVVISVDYLFAD